MAHNAYLRNAWYVAAWSSEVTRGLLERTVLEQSIVLYRKENGDVAAIGNACPHRLAPLSLGKLVGDTVQCGYHGLRFDSSGACVHNPHAGGMVPPKMRVPQYTLVERHGMIWLWFGDEDKANPASIPDFSCHLDPELAFVGGVIEMKANYELITDNLLDLAHGEFVHEGLLSSPAITNSKLETIQKGTTIWSNRWMPDGEALPAHAMLWEHFTPNKNCDQWAYMRWDAPAHMLLDVGITGLGRPRTEGAWVYGTDILTPKDQHNTYYFWGITRAYKTQDPAAGDLWRQVIKGAFEGQDQVIIEAQQRMLGTRSLEDANAVMFASDVAAQRARKLLASLIDKGVVPDPQNPDLRGQRRASELTAAPITPAV